ncbi:hypothetical protein PR048_024631 [Dryococelus australis]|uniref:C2H2-type domain-containing protein n=1 Tax=Dryococelus australis TaxID=614101 RepID=A0ABQ9GP44_9NEOP|nr:hypothetical protein PR048_024631 [Dryococelus australis]
MPKNAVSAGQRTEEFRSEGLYGSDAFTLMCNHCSCKVSYERRDTVLKHVKGEKHTSIAESINSAKRKKADIEHLELRTEVFSKANIHLEKLENTDIQN